MANSDEVTKINLTRVDGVCNGNQRGDFLARLQSGTPLVEIAEEFGIVQNALEKRHLERQFFGEWWPEAQSRAGGSGVEKVFREGLIQALENAEGLPIDCYHTWYPADDGPVLIALCLSEHQLTFILQTPRPLGDALQSTDEIIIVSADATGVQVKNLGITGD